MLPREIVSFVFPRVSMFPSTSSRETLRLSMFPSTSSRETLRLSGKQNSLFRSGAHIKCIISHYGFCFDSHGSGLVPLLGIICTCTNFRKCLCTNLYSMVNHVKQSHCMITVATSTCYTRTFSIFYITISSKSNQYSMRGSFFF